MVDTNWAQQTHDHTKVNNRLERLHLGSNPIGVGDLVVDTGLTTQIWFHDLGFHVLGFTPRDF